MRVDYVVAPYEADAQMYHLERIGLVDGIITEDSDLLVFGAKKVGVVLIRALTHNHLRSSSNSSRMATVTRLQETDSAWCDLMAFLFARGSGLTYTSAVWQY